MDRPEMIAELLHRESKKLIGGKNPAEYKASLEEMCDTALRMHLDQVERGFEPAEHLPTFMFHG